MPTWNVLPLFYFLVEPGQLEELAFLSTEPDLGAFAPPGVPTFVTYVRPVPSRPVPSHRGRGLYFNL